MGMLQTVAMGTNITIFLLFLTYLLPFLELAPVYNLETRQSCEYFNLKKMKNLSRGFSKILKILQFPIFNNKKKNPWIKFFQKIIL